VDEPQAWCSLRIHGLHLQDSPRRAADAPQPRREVPRDCRRARLGGCDQEAVAEGIPVRRWVLWLAERVRPEDRLLLPRLAPGDSLLSGRGPGAAECAG